MRDRNFCNHAEEEDRPWLHALEYKASMFQVGLIALRHRSVTMLNVDADEALINLLQNGTKSTPCCL